MVELQVEGYLNAKELPENISFRKRETHPSID
jgi:hypothetical protein